MKQSVLFVCLGNICRSPLAEAAFRQVASKAKLSFRVDSAGTGNWHAGDAPDRRAQQVARHNGADITGYRARQVRPQDFHDFSHIIALDRNNLSDLAQMQPPDAPAKLILLLDFVPERAGQSVADPYYGGLEDFAICWRDVAAGAEGLLRQLIDQPNG